PYETVDKAQWTAHTVSHNTMVVDGVSQEPSGKGDRQWPVDSAAARVVGRLERFEPAQRLAAAACDSAYAGIRLRRTVQLSRHCVVDDYLAVSTDSAAHRFDYVLHVDGDFAESSLPLEPRSGRLGDACGYQRVEQKQGATAAGPATLEFTAGKRRFRVWLVPLDGAPTELVLAEGPTNSPTAKVPMLVLRRSAAQARFVTVFEPVESGAILQSVRAEPQPGGKGLALVLQWPSSTERLTLAP
ncbi:MAG: heparinase II/III domain-containing protein, partial [Thermoguttaceae bacterium]